MATLPFHAPASSSADPVEDAWLGAAGIEELLAKLLLLGHQVEDPAATARTAIELSRSSTSLDASHTPEIDQLQVAVRIAGELARRAAVERAQRRQLTRAEDLALVADAQLTEADRERLLVLVCDAGNRLRRAAVVTEGTADRLLIPVREILALVLKQGGRAFAVAHNHPSGDTTPSPADIEGTRTLAVAAKTVGLRFLGHVIVADGRWQAVGSAEVRECGVDG